MENNIRHYKIQNRVRKQIEKECMDKIESLKSRGDYIDELDPFLNALFFSIHPDKLQEKTSRPVVGLFCIQAPFELFDAFKLQPFKLCGGSYEAQHLSTSKLPALACPIIKSTMGILNSDDHYRNVFKTIIIPTTCDWVVKFAELAEYNIPELHFMELPHIKENEKGEQRWLLELLELKRFLGKIMGIRLKRKDLLNSVNRYLAAWKYFNKLIELRRDNNISALLFTIIVNAFPFMEIENWTDTLKAVIKKYEMYKEKIKHRAIFLAGAPIVFPNLKMLDLIEEAGMNVTADDICSSERIFPGGACYDDTSEHGLMKALSDRYHKACICPTYADNTRRVNGIFNTLEENGINGVVYHVLKGCHPYDIESISVEKKIKDRGYRFIKIETDYVDEDRQNILTRLEAFNNTL